MFGVATHVLSFADLFVVSTTRVLVFTLVRDFVAWGGVTLRTLEVQFLSSLLRISDQHSTFLRLRLVLCTLY